MAVGEGAVEFLPNSSPPFLFTLGHSQPQGLAALRGDEFAGGDEELETQGVEADAVEPTELALEEHDEIVAAHRRPLCPRSFARSAWAARSVDRVP